MYVKLLEISIKAFNFLDFDVLKTYILLIIFNVLLRMKFNTNKLVTLLLLLGTTSCTQKLNVTQTNQKQLEKSIPSLIQMLQDKDASVRANAANTIANIALPYRSADATVNTATSALLVATQDANTNVRINASRALGIVAANAALGATPNKDIDTKAVVSRLLKLLQDKNPQVRASAAYALAELGGGIKATESAVPDLIKALEDTEPGTRFYAAKALGRIGTKASSGIPALTNILQNNQKYESISTAHQSVVPVTVLSLGNIAMSLQSDSSNLSKSTLITAITDLSATIKIIEDPKNKYSPEIIASVRNPLENLKKQLKNR